MSTSRRRALGLLLGGLLLTFLPASAPAVVVLFKDGFIVQGRITHATEFIVDPPTGKAYPVPVGGAPFVIEDQARKVIFTPEQVHDVLSDPPQAIALMEIRRFAPSLLGAPLPGGLQIESTGDWDSKWQRHLTVNTSKGPIELDQRLTMLTPKVACMDALKRNWRPFYKTGELGAETVRTLLHDYYRTRREKVPDEERRLLVARFLLQAGWTEMAQKELEGLKIVTSQQEEAARIQDSIRKVQAVETAEALQMAYKAGQYRRTSSGIDRFFKQNMGDLAGDKTTAKLQELRSRLDTEELRLSQAQRFLKVLPEGVAGPDREAFSEKAAVILQELTLDTLPRLEKFIELAREWDQAKKQKRDPQRNPQHLLSYALSGWLLGNEPAEDDSAFALDLWRTREMILKYQRGEDAEARKALLAAHQKGSKLSPDVVARLIRYLPPPEPPEKLGPLPLKLTGRPADGGKGAEYLLQLPPEYSPYRSYPVLIVLHKAGEKPAQALEHWKDLGARYGFLLAAPTWGGNTGYHYSASEHAAALDCLRDLRLRFGVDSDRVFLFGAEEGGLMAYDLGLAHPDEFAGVGVMSAAPYLFPGMYRTNGQYLPFYVVDGDRNGLSAETNKKHFERWVRLHYPVLFVEYRGRGKDWFGAELPILMDWMSRKKRAHPMQELGRSNRSEEFYTMRETDNRFYWLGTSSINKNCLNDADAWRNVRPATLQAKIAGTNNISVRTTGVRQVTIWLGAGMVNFTQPVRVFLNAQPGGRALQVRPSLETLLEDFYQRGDRLRLFLAKIDLKF
jgi:pimeloyl-ACP methyl ester carboxylesterase